MDAIKLLKDYKLRLDVYLQKYFDQKIAKAGKTDPLAEEAVKMIADFTLAGGKRIRPALIYYSYLAAGGSEEEKIIETSMSIELTHTFLLIHDDIIDKDSKRHGISTIHERYKEIGQKISSRKDPMHFGNSMAMLAGDMAGAMANEIIFNSAFSPKTIIKALDKLQEIVYRIVPGEMLDVVLETRGEASEEEVLKMYEGKTSSYSFEGPLHLGTLLAGEFSQEVLEKYSTYAMPLGKAFQIRDDILGLFGDEKKTGKPIGSDIAEGKQTLLVIKALELGSKEQKKNLEKILGKKDIGAGEIEQFRKIIKSCGSLEYCQDLAEKFISESLQALSEIVMKSEDARKFLEGIAQYMISREQ